MEHIPPRLERFAHLRNSRWIVTWNDVLPAKTQISLRIRKVWSESSLSALTSQVWKISECGQRRLWSDCADAQFDLCLRKAHMSVHTLSYNKTCIFRGIFIMFILKTVYWNTHTRTHARTHTHTHTHINHLYIQPNNKICQLRIPFFF